VLAEDIGRALGCGGYLLMLRRTAIRDLGLEYAIRLEELGEMDETARAAQLLPVDQLVEILPAIYLDQQASQRIVKWLGRWQCGHGCGPCQIVRFDSGVHGCRGES